jgi:hypothetical protein
MLRKYPKFVLFLVLFCLIGTGVFYFSDNWKGDDNQTQTTQNLKLLTSHSSPQAGEKWAVSFETTGVSDLTITPEDPETIGDLDFISLTCNGEERTPKVLENDDIFYPNWECLSSEASAKEGAGKGELTHLVNIARKHTLKFQFGDKMAFAYNNPDSVTDTFSDISKIATTSNITISTSTGQVYLATCKDNGTSCLAAGECCSGNCIDGYCCNTACSGNCDRCNVVGSLGACTNVDSDCTGNCDVCTLGNCAANNSLCNCDTCSGSITVFNCLNDNVTTNWGAGTYGCTGSNKRCYQGFCKTCTNGASTYFYSDGCSGCAGQGGNVCWRKGTLENNCNTVCTNYSSGSCVSANWNDTTSCTVMLYFQPSLLSCSTYGGSDVGSLPHYEYISKTAIWSANYRGSSDNQNCSLAPGGADIDEYRVCVCQF